MTLAEFDRAVQAILARVARDEQEAREGDAMTPRHPPLAGGSIKRGRRMNGRKNLIGGLLWLTVLAIWGVVVYAMLLAPVPVVSKRWPDGACVRVDPPHTCNALPGRYETQWVGPEAGP